MIRLHPIASLSVGLALIALAAPQALAFAQSAQPINVVPAPTSKAAQEAFTLSPIVVEGQTLPLPIVLQTIKTGLSLPWTNDMSDTRIRCRVESSGGSHFKTLWCEGNRHHIQRLIRLHTAMVTSMSGAGGSIPMSNAALTLGLHGGHRIYAGALKGLLAKLPPAGSSYTLRVPASDGKPQIDYIVKDGELVKVLKYPLPAKSDSN